jgi:saccharopine dehydrogenase (NAD+, L-lysine-forming)
MNRSEPVLDMRSKDYPWMIYGASGLSGELIARKAVAQGLRPILAGRDATAVRKLAEDLDLSWRSFEINDWGRFRREISPMNLLVNAAGPLMQTSVLVAESCLAAHTHYFDLNNQIPSLVAMYTLDAEAKEKNLTLLPGLALSPAVSNCLVKHLHTLFPDADAVDIALEPFMRRHSPGAHLTIVENILEGGFRRRGGFLERCWFGEGLIEMELPTGSRRLFPGALGDIEAAYRCTGIPNITAYIVTDIPSFSNGVRRAAAPASVHPLFNEFSRQPWDDKDTSTSLVWVRMSKLGKRSLEGWIQFGEAHEFTAAVMVAGVSRLANNDPLSTGAHTPATALGADFILDLPDVKRSVQPLKELNDVSAINELKTND